MTHRFLIYPVLFMALVQLVPVWTGERWWRRTQIAQLLAVIAASVTGLVLRGSIGMWAAGVAWVIYLGFFVAPRVLITRAARLQAHGRWLEAAQWERVAGRIMGGGLGQLHAGRAEAMQLMGWDNALPAEARLDELAAQPMPASARATARVWKLSLMTEHRAWARAVAWFEATEDWGTTATMTQARVLVARAYAETGRMEPALRCVQFAVLSPAVVRVEETLWQLRVRLAAMAGDMPELERLLARRRLWRRGFARFAAYWRGRCALARGERAEGVKLLSRAYSLTHPDDRAWREAVRFHLSRAEENPGAGAAVEPWAAMPGYQLGMEAVRLAEKQAGLWRALMGMRTPAVGTLVLLGEMTLVFVVQMLLLESVEDRFVRWAANGPVVLKRHEWWRLFTAMFVHGNLLHLAMNGLGVWLFGSAVERAFGMGRMLAVFFIGGAAGNLLSAWAARCPEAIGASGGVFALMGAFAVAVMKMRGAVYQPVRSRLLVFLAVAAAADLTIGGLEPVVDNLAHAGGLAAGLVLGAVCFTAARRGSVPPV